MQSVQSAKWSVKCGVWSVKCGMESLKCEECSVVPGVQCEV